MNKKTLCHLAFCESDEFKIVFPSKIDEKMNYKLYSPEELGMVIIPTSNLSSRTNTHKRERRNK